MNPDVIVSALQLFKVKPHSFFKGLKAMQQRCVFAVPYWKKSHCKITNIKSQA